MEITKLFDNILDLPGVEGACLFSTEGPIYMNRLPPFITDELFADAQRRISAMYETMDENFLPCEDYVLKYTDRWLLIRRKDEQILIILASDSANMASTRMVTNMSMKHFTAENLGTLQAAQPLRQAAAPTVSAEPEPEEEALPEPAAKSPPPVAKEAPKEEKKHVRMYRGRPY